MDSGWYVQGQQTLTPRWFVAARVERIDRPAAARRATGPRQTFAGAEETVGFRITPEVTLRASYRGAPAVRAVRLLAPGDGVGRLGPPLVLMS